MNQPFCLSKPVHARNRDAMQCCEMSTVTQEAQDKEEKQHIAYPARSNCHQTEILLRLPTRESDAKQWGSGNTKCNKGDTDCTKGKERCLQPVKRWCVAYQDADLIGDSDRLCSTLDSAGPFT